MIWDWCFLNYSKNFSYILEQYNKAIQCYLSLLSIAGRPGRPSINIPPEVLEDLRGIGFTWVKITKVFKVSRWTIMRRVRLFDLEHLSLQYHYWWRNWRHYSWFHVNRLCLEHPNLIARLVAYPKHFLVDQPLFKAFLDLHSWRKRSMHTLTLHLKRNVGGQSAGILWKTDSDPKSILSLNPDPKIEWILANIEWI